MLQFKESDYSDEDLCCPHSYLKILYFALIVKKGKKSIYLKWLNYNTNKIIDIFKKDILKDVIWYKIF